MQSIHNAVISEFGNSTSEERVGTTTSRGETVISDLPAGTTRDSIELVESLSETSQGAEIAAEA